MSWPSCLLPFLWFSKRPYQGQSLLQVTLFDVVVVRLLSEGLDYLITDFWPFSSLAYFFLTTDFLNVEFND